MCNNNNKPSRPCQSVCRAAALIPMFTVRYMSSIEWRQRQQRSPTDARRMRIHRNSQMICNRAMFFLRNEHDTVVCVSAVLLFVLACVSVCVWIECRQAYKISVGFCFHLYVYYFLHHTICA